MNIKINTVSIEIHHLIKMIERYHDSFRRVHAIIITKICWNRFELDFANDIQNVASSDTEAGLRNHVMWLQSRDVTKMTVYRSK
jgi:hypothetical protein